MTITIESSVGLNGVNRPADVLAVKTRLVELGFTFITPDDVMGPLTVKAIRLFQAAKNGLNVVNDQRNDGRVDVNGDTLKWLQAVNAPQWGRMPAGAVADGFVNDNIADLTDNHDFGTSWMTETLRATGAAYRDSFLGGHPAAAVLHINDTSLPQGGDTPMHHGHEAGMASDIRLPRRDGNVGGITVHSSTYDRDAMRAMIRAFRSQPQASRVFLSDAVLVGEHLCQAVQGHLNHAHFEIKPPTRIMP
ncbi:MAG TPA: peptidoglycan-binding domain-containing protein [Pyrinomonadaceae bacterium]